MEHFCEEVKDMLDNYFKEKNQIYAQNIPARCQQCKYDLTPEPFTWLNMTSLYQKGEKILFCDQHINHEDTSCVYMNLTDGSFWCRTCETRFNTREDFTEFIGSILNTNDSPGTRGLINLGNTCFINSVVQSLSNCSKLKNFFQKIVDDQNQDPPKYQFNKLISEFQKLILSLWRKGENILPRDFVDVVYETSDWFIRKQQSDAHELLMFLLDYINDNLKTHQINVIEEIFQGETSTITTCLNCNNITQKEEKFFDINIPVPDIGNVSDTQDTKLKIWISKLTSIASIFTKGKRLDLGVCLGAHFESVYIGDNDMGNWRFCYQCDEKAPFKLNTFLKKPPINLIVVLKKYSRHSKSNANVFFPEIVDLKEFLENKNSKAVYYLYAMIEHVGFMNMGHYKCYCKNHMDKKWYCFNDRNIKEVTIAEVLKTQGYIGFYELEEVPQ